MTTLEVEACARMHATSRAVMFVETLIKKYQIEISKEERIKIAKAISDAWFPIIKATIEANLKYGIKFPII
jgi:F0F1-type ATP synthase gamma subunit